jgi:putative glycosyltransferase
MLISLVSTLYRSEAFIEEFVRRALSSVSAATDDFEIILVDDGSPDRSLAVAKGLLPKIPQLRIVELARNFGHHPAILAGLRAARGELIFFVDSDLEETPELLAPFLEALEDNDVVFGIQSDDDSRPFLRRATSKLFWAAISKLANVEMPADMLNVRLMRRTYVDALLSMPDRNLFLGGMFAWPGFRQHAIKVNRNSRRTTSYSWFSRLRLAVQAAVGFSNTPLYLVFVIGLVLTVVSFSFGLFLLVSKLLHPQMILDGFTAIMLSIWFLGGMLLFCVGVLGFYVAHVYNQARQRPLYFVREVHGAPRDAGD